MPLAVYLASVVWRLFAGDAPVVATIGTVALVVWAVLEILWGVNPFRRILGAVVLVFSF